MARKSTTSSAWPHTLKKAGQTYRRIFSIQEFEADYILQWGLGILLTLLLFNFKEWSSSLSTTVLAVQNKTYICWQFFQNCGEYFFLKLPPEGISQSVFFALLLALVGTGIFFAYRKQWAAAHLCAIIAYSARFYPLAISASYGANFWLYITYFGFVILFLPHKKFFAQLLVVMCYFLSTTSKIGDGWILGTYFTSMQNGLPLFPHGSEIFLTNLVLFMEMAACWLLFSSKKILQRSIFTFFITFHIYSSLIVGQTFPVIITPWLVLMFGAGFAAYKQIPLDKKSWGGWTFITTLIFIQLISVMIPGDDRHTQEIGSFSLRMISSSNQSRSFLYDNNILIDRRTGPGPEVTGATAVYGNFFSLKARFCPSARPLHFVYDHSSNGGPYYRIIDQPDLCALTYKPFSHNRWIGDESNSLIVGKPLMGTPMVNYTTRDSRMKISILNKKAQPVTLNRLQTLLQPHLYTLTTMWWCLWFGLLTYMFSRFLLLAPHKK